MLKYLTKMAMDILPSVLATILGAYIVNHYISNKAETPPVAAAVAPATPADVASLPQAGVRAKGISEKSVFEKPITAKPAEKPQEKAQEKPEEKAAEKKPESTEDKPSETASIPAEPKRATPHEKEKTAIRTIPLTATPAVQPAAAAASAAPTVEAAVTPEERRDANANDLARAAIERLRGSHAPEANRASEASRAGSPVLQQQASAPVRPLPPPIMVSTPPAEQPGPVSPMQQGFPNSARNDDPNRPTPPADIPGARPLDLQAGATPVDQPAPPREQHKNVAEDMLTGVKSMFHAVLPQ